MAKILGVQARGLARFGSFALLALAALMLSGCLTITAVDAPSGPPSSTYTVTLSVEIPSAEEYGDPLDEDVRGLVAVRFPGEWELVSATYTGAVAGTLTSSEAISDLFATEYVAMYAPDDIPGISLRDKPGYQWWAGYSAVHPGTTPGPIEVRLVVDEHGAAGASSLDFFTGLADPVAPEDIEQDALWVSSMALDRPVFTGLAADNVAPQVFWGEPPVLYAATGLPVVGMGGVFDPDTAEPEVTVDYGDGQSDRLELISEGPVLGLLVWQWEHAWNEKGTYTVTVRGDDGASTAETTATVRVGQSPFSDLPAEHEFFPAIVALWNQQIVSGYPDGTFRPYEPVLRAQLAKMAVMAFWYHDEELTNVDMPTFTDVPPSSDPYPFDFVEEAARYYLVSGFADDTFRPWEPLTRMQLVRVIVRSQELFLEDPPPDYRLPFGDVPEADRKYVSIAHYNGLVDGKSPTHFDPYGIATRGHVAKILYNGVMRTFESPEEPPPFEAAGMRALALRSQLGPAH